MIPPTPCGYYCPPIVLQTGESWWVTLLTAVVTPLIAAMVGAAASYFILRSTISFEKNRDLDRSDAETKRRNDEATESLERRRQDARTNAASELTVSILGSTEQHGLDTGDWLLYEFKVAAAFDIFGARLRYDYPDIAKWATAQADAIVRTPVEEGSHGCRQRAVRNLRYWTLKWAADPQTHKDPSTFIDEVDSERLQAADKAASSAEGEG